MRTIAVDIELIFGVDVSPTVDEVKTGLESVLGQLEPVKIKFSGNFEDIKHEADELRKTLGEGGKGIQLVDASNFDSLNKIVDQLTEIVSLVREINSKQFTITASFGGNKTDVEELRLYKQEAEALARTVDGMAGALHKMDGRTLSSALDANLSRRLVNLNEEYKHLPTYLGNIDSATTVSGVRKIIAVLGEYKRVYDEVFARANIPMPTEALDRTTAELEEYLKRRKEAAANLKDALTPSGAPTTDASTAAATDSLDKFKTLSVDIGDVLKGIRTQIEETFDLSTVDLHTEDLKKQLSEILEMKEQLPDLPNNGGGNGGGGGGGNDDGQARIDELRAEAEASGELAREREKVSQSGRTVEESTYRLNEADRKRIISLKKVAAANGEVRESAAVTNDYAAKEREDAKATRENANAKEMLNRALHSADDAMGRYAKAQNSVKASSRDAYKNISEQRDELERLWAQYQNDGNFEAFREGVNNASRAIQSNTQTLRENREGASTLGDKLKGVMAHYISLQRAVGLVIRSMREMIQASMELDKALTQMRIVTGSSDAEMKRFADSAFEAADRAGAKVTDIISGATTYARLGFSSSVATQLAELTTMLQNVGDIQTQDAQDAITAILMAFDDIDEKNIEQKLDKIVKVGNSFPISVSQIAEGMNNGASMYAAAGNTFEESVALLTAANATVQNAAKASTGLRTITARIRKNKSELDELGEAMTESEHNDLVKAFTNARVALVGVNGEYRSTYQIFKELSEVWGTLGDDVKAGLAQVMGSTRNQNIFYSLINNFGLAEDAVTAMADTEGELAEKNKAFVESIEGFVKRFKNEFTELATEIFKSDWVKDALSMAKDALKVIADIAKVLTGVVKALGGIKVVLPAILMTYTGFKLAKGVSTLTKLASTIQSVTTAGTGLSIAQKLMLKGNAELATSSTGAAGAIGALGKGLASTVGVAGAVGIGLAAVAVGIARISRAVDDAKLEKINREISSASTELDDAKKKSKEAESALASATKELENNKAAYKDIVTLNPIEYVSDETLQKLQTATGELRQQAEYAAEISAEEKGKVGRAFGHKMNAMNETPGDYGVFDLVNRYEYVSPMAKLFSEEFANYSALSDFLKSTTKDVGTFEKYPFPWWLSFSETIDELVKWAQEGKFDEAVRDDLIDYLNSLVEGVDFFDNPTTKLEKDANWWLDKVLDKLILLGDESALDTQIIRWAKKYGFTSYEEVERAANAPRGSSAREDVYWFLQNSRRVPGDIISLDRVKQAFDNVGDSAEGAEDDVSGFGESLDSTAADADDAASNLTGLAGAMKDASIASKGLDLLGNIYKDVADKGSFDYSSLVSDDFIKEFGDLPGFQNFIETVTNAPENIDACKQAFDDLALSYVTQEKFLKNLNGETADTIAKMLEQAGVANAEALVANSLAGAYNKVTLAKKGLRAEDIETIDDIENLIDVLQKAGMSAESLHDLYDAKDLMEVVAEERAEGMDLSSDVIKNQLSQAQNAIAHWFKNEYTPFVKNLYATGDLVAVKLYNIALEKYKLNEATLNTVDDVQALIDLAEQAGATARTLETLARIKGLMSDLDEIDASRPAGLAIFADPGAMARWAVQRGLILKQIQELKDSLVGEAVDPGRFSGGGFNPLLGPTDSPPSTEKVKTWFDAQYAEHKHLVAMEQETDEDYYNWLEGAMKQAYAEGIISLEDYWKYEEEVFNGRKKNQKEEKSWFEKEMADHKHRVAMEKETEQDYYDWFVDANERAYKEGIISQDEYFKNLEDGLNKSKALFKDFLSDIDAEIDFRQEYDGQAKAIIALNNKAIARIDKEIAAARARGLDNSSDYIQGLLKDKQKYEKSNKSIEDQITQDAKSATDKIIDTRRQMIKQELQDQRDALQQELDDFRDAQNKKIDELHKFYDKQREMLQDSYDEEDYLEEQAEKRRSVSDIEEEIERLRYDNSAWAQRRRAELQEKLADARKDLSDFERDHARDETLDFLDRQEEEQTDKLTDELDAKEKTINDKLEAIDKRINDTYGIYQQAVTDIQNMNADLYGSMIEWNRKYGTGVDEDVTTPLNEAYGALWNFAQLYGKTFNGINLPNLTGWKPNAMPKGSGYASGTYSATPGIHQIDEAGDETYFSTSTGKKYKMFSGGEKVLNAKASDFLYRFANGGSEMLRKFIEGVGSGVLSDRVSPLMTSNEIVMGDVVVQGNVDRSTVSEIRRAQRESVEFMLKEFGKLNR